MLACAILRLLALSSTACLSRAAKTDNLHQKEFADQGAVGFHHMPATDSTRQRPYTADPSPDGEIGRHSGLKIRRHQHGVPVQVRLGAPDPFSPKTRSPCGLHHRGFVHSGGAARSRTGLDGFAIRCITALLPRHGHQVSSKTGPPGQTPDKKGSPRGLPFKIWSGIRDSNSRPIPWQGIALPTELIPHFAFRNREKPRRCSLRFCRCSGVAACFAAPTALDAQSAKNATIA